MCLSKASPRPGVCPSLSTDHTLADDLGELSAHACSDCEIFGIYHSITAEAILFQGCFLSVTEHAGDTTAEPF